MSELKVNPYYEEFVEGLGNSQWLEQQEYREFSRNKTLYDSQVQAIRNSVKLLEKWGEIAQEETVYEAKQDLYKSLYRESDGKIDSHHLRLKKKEIGHEVFHKLRERYPVKERARYGYDYEEVDFENFANQMGLWMATGSGKTLVIIKLIELTYRMSNQGLIPDRDILLLVPSDDIMEQFREETKEYNKHGEYSISFHDAEKFDEPVQSSISSSFGSTINVYTKRSDLVSDETKEKEISFEDIENGGNWYLFLDEAHKGESSSSKRQAYYSILSRNGFMFNASATFTDPEDISTTVYNYNIERYNSDGYGKNIYLADDSLEAITEDEFDEDTKKKIVLKSLIALTAQKNSREKVDFEYHDPLLTAFVNSVNTTDSDLELFFRVIEEIGKRKDKEVFDQAKQELRRDIQNEKAEYEFGNDSFNWVDISNIEKRDVLKQVYNSESHASIEVKHSPDNKKEIAFRLKSSPKPFALMRIGRKSDWLKEKLKGKSVEENYDFRSYFDNINSEDSPINLLLGSRTFYEGWDSNRPNVMLFINLGRSSKKKLVMQAIGRGMRIEPKPGLRRRLSHSGIKVPESKEEYISTIESLFVFATSVDNFDNIIDSFDIIREQEVYDDVSTIRKSEETESHELLIPVYRDGSLPDLTKVSNFQGNREMLKKFWDTTSEEMIMMHTNASPEIFTRMEKFIFNHKKKFDHPEYEYSPIKQLKRLKNHLSSRKKELPNSSDQKPFIDASNDENKRIHFDKIKVKKDDKEEVENNIEELLKFDSDTDTVKGATIRDVKNHYYRPILYTSSSSSKSFKNIIDVDSETDFVEKLSQSIQEGLFKESDWWQFSAISEHLDEIYIPYADNKKFKPDFIFWVKNGENYDIIFVDPKSSTHANPKKINGYKDAFEEGDGSVKEFSFNGYNVKVHLCLFNSEINYDRIPKEYQKYWKHRIEELEYIIS